MIIDDIMTKAITLHGLGFVQIQLQGNQRLHVWHPELPRRTCYKYSAIHNHRFGFRSRVLVGEQIDIPCGLVLKDTGEFQLYLHEGARTANGGRPWVPDGRADIWELPACSVKPGASYDVAPYDYHRTVAGGNGKVATILGKTVEGSLGAHSSCIRGVEPDIDFDRFQWSPSKLWEIVQDVLTTHTNTGE